MCMAVAWWQWQNWNIPDYCAAVYKKIHHDALYEDVGCEVSKDFSECGLILGIKQPKVLVLVQLEMILPDRAYAFFSHTHKAQRENMFLLDKVLSERATLLDYELIVGDHGKRSLAFGRFAGRAGMIDFLCGLGQRFLSLGYSTSFLSLGASYMYSSLAMAKAAVISVGEEIATMGLPSGICVAVRPLHRHLSRKFHETCCSTFVLLVSLLFILLVAYENFLNVVNYF